MLSRLTTAVFVCIFGSIRAACPRGFEMNADACYYFSNGEETWIGAYESCKLFDAMLVEVNSADEDAYLINRTSSSGDSWWIGLSDKLIEGEYVWETSMSVLGASGFSNWAAGEPNNHKNENCVKYSHSHNYLWQDTECDDKGRYICEKSNDITDIGG